MPDLFAHVCLAYVLCRPISWRVDWVSNSYVTLGMVGAFIPDLTKIELLLSGRRVGELLGVPFSWGSFTTGGGVVLSILIGVVLLESSERTKGGTMLTIGAVSHLVADSLLLTPTGRTIQFLWPVSQYSVPSPGLYLSTQPGPTIVAGAGACVVWMFHRYRFRNQS